MNTGHFDSVLRHIHRMIGKPPANGQTDRHLLERFTGHHDESAFATLVERHAGLVYGVCWRTLRHTQDAEDAFQASFLVLARKAGSISWMDSISSWLYQVAYRIAAEIKTNTARRRTHERQAGEMHNRQATDATSGQELAQVIDEELHRLPDKYRAPLLLCYLQGETTDQAARHLGWSLRTLERRLQQGRKVLRGRLTRRGLTLSAALLAVELVKTSAQASIPASLVSTTTEAATGLVGLAPAAGAGVSTKVLTLVDAATSVAKWTSVKIAAAVVGFGIVFSGVGFLTYSSISSREATESGTAEGRNAPVDPTKLPIFLDRTADTGINHSYRNGQEAGHLAILESLGGGVALIDYDRDGLLDIFVTGGGYYDGSDKKEIKGHPCRLYKNLGNWQFKDVTSEVGLDKIDWTYTHGCAVADYDNDGWPDLLVTGWGRVTLLHNESNGKDGRRFVDVTQKAGLNDSLWSTSAAWADLDGDGFPDLYICHYVDWSFKKHPPCHYKADKTPDVCPPKTFDALPHVLYRNNGNGTFTDVSKEAGILEPHALKQGKALGIVIADFNGDGLPDIYLANDEMDNLLYLNRGNMKFQEEGVFSGSAKDDNGAANGSMGVDAADYDGTGRMSIFVTNYQNEVHALYRNVFNPALAPSPPAQFVYASRRAGIAAIGLNYVGFGTGFIDYDLDGAEDLFITNGHVIRHPIPPAELLQRPVLLRNLRKPGDKPWEVRFQDVSAEAGPFFQTKHMGRGAAFGDLDNDGRTDIVISHVNEPAVLLQNNLKNGNHWLGIELVGKPYRDAVGAKLILEVGDQKLMRMIKGGGSYLSASDRRVLFGLGKSDKVGRLTVTWPSGQPRTQTWENLAIDQYHKLEQAAKTK
jgi:RNA polymerase sigma factor (sigma-70 family)